MSAKQEQFSATKTDDGRRVMWIEPEGSLRIRVEEIGDDDWTAGGPDVPTGQGDTPEAALADASNASARDNDAISRALGILADINFDGMVEALYAALDSMDDESPGETSAATDDRSATGERTPEDIIETHDAFIEERRDGAESPTDAGGKPGHIDPDVHRHRENVQRLVSKDEEE